MAEGVVCMCECDPDYMCVMWTLLCQEQKTTNTLDPQAINNHFPLSNNFKFFVILNYDSKGIKRLLNRDVLSGWNEALGTLLTNFGIIKIKIIKIPSEKCFSSST